MIKKICLFTFLFVSILSCGNDDEEEFEFVPARDRGEEVSSSTAIIEEYLETHFYNYEEFESPASDFDYKVSFDTISGENLDKIPLINQVEFKMVQDRVDADVNYKFYYLIANQGGGERPLFPDITTMSYEGRYVSNEEGAVGGYSEIFDSFLTPASLDLTQVVDGFQEGVIEFNTSPNEPIINPDGTVTFTDFASGAVFIPSGLGYYVNPPQGSGIPVYAQLIFTFEIFEKREGDQDNDGILSIFEDLNGNMIEEDDDTDGDRIPNFADADDDNDGRPTIEEIVINEDGTITYPDEDGDGVVDYLDSDS